MLPNLADSLPGILTGLALLLGAGPLRRRGERRRSARLAEIDAGAREAFLEERRSLEAYPLPGVAALRLLGGALVLLGLALALR